MISPFSSSASISTTSLMYDQQIQTLNAQVTRLKSQVSGLQERILDTRGNERLSADEKKEHIRSIGEQISRLKEREQEVGKRIAETRKRQIKAENEAEKQRQAAEAKAPKADSGEEAGAVDRAFIHAIIGID